MITGLRCKPVARAEVCSGARPCPQPWAAGEGPEGAETRPPDTAGNENIFAPFMAGVLWFARVPKANHIASIDPKGRGRELELATRHLPFLVDRCYVVSLGYRYVVSLGYPREQ